MMITTSEAFDLFPLPAGAKMPPPEGVTGFTGNSTWRDEWADHSGNWGARLRPGYVGIDIDGADHGEGKIGPESIAALEADIGALPSTAFSTRHGEESDTRILLFRVPEGVVLTEKPLEGVEIIQHHHRYIACAPSIVDGRAYAWYDFMGETEGPVGISDLPAAWIEYLRADAREPIHIATTDEVQAFLDGLSAEGMGPRTLAALEAISARGGNDSELMWKVVRGVGAIAEDGSREAFELLHDALEGSYAAEYGDAAWDRQWRRALEKAVGKIAPASAAPSTDPEDLWTCGRPEIEHIMASARRLKVSPWSLLSGVLGRAACSIPYSVPVQTFMGRRPVNMIFALSGSTGAGKSAADDAVEDIFLWPREFGPLLEAGSGEAMATQFAYIAPKDDESAGVRAGDLVWRHADHTVRFGFDEIGRLNAVQGRQGSTVLEYIKTGESGAGLGRVLAGAGGVQIPKHQYRMTVSLNIQPERAHLIMSADEAAGGFPGRMLWADTHYAPFVGVPRDRSRIVPMKLPAVQWNSGDVIEALPEIDDLLDAQRDAGLAGTLDAMESHALLLRLKVAACLMVLAGRKTLVSEDWELAELIMEHSRGVRAYVLGKVEVAAYSARAAHGAKAERIIESMKSHRDSGLSLGEARRKLASRDRPIADALLESGDIETW